MLATSTSTNTNPMQLDDRAGSGEMLPYLRARAVPTIVTRLPYGDIALLGNGPDECPVTVGAEIKAISDILKCITDGRFAGHQLPGLVTTYDYTWLVAEGSYRSDPRSGILQCYAHGGWRDFYLGSRRFMARELEQWLLTISIRGGVRIVRTFNHDETADFLRNLYSWWTSKLWAQHRSHLVSDESHVPDRALLTRPSLSRMVAKELPGIGWEKSLAVAEKFSTVAELACAEVDEWASIAGIGPKTARKVVTALRTGKTI